MGNRGVCLAAANRPFLQKLTKVLLQHSVPVLGVAYTDDMAVRMCHSMYPDVLVTHQHLRSGSGFVAANALLGQTPAIVLCPRSEADYPAPGDVQTLYLPVNASVLLNRIEQLSGYGRALRMVSQHLKLTEQRDLIAQAKSQLMHQHGMSEPQAHAYLQRISMDRRIKLYEAAQTVLARMGMSGRSQN